MHCRWYLATALACSIFALPSAGMADPREETGFGSNPGNLRMFSYVSAGLKTRAPLIVVLHGCKQRAGTFAHDAGWLDLAESTNAALLLPEQKGLNPFWYDVAWVAPLVGLLGANNQNACFNWFQPGDVARDRGEALSIAQMIAAMIARYPVDPSRVYIAGLSAGGAMTAAMLAAYPERFAGGAIVAGVPYGCADTVIRALNCMNLALIECRRSGARHWPEHRPARRAIRPSQSGMATPTSVLCQATRLNSLNNGQLPTGSLESHRRAARQMGRSHVRSTLMRAGRQRSRALWSKVWDTHFPSTLAELLHAGGPATLLSI
jgi:predicted esterase